TAGRGRRLRRTGPEVLKSEVGGLDRLGARSRRRTMPHQDFRQFLDALRREGELVDVDRPIELNDVGKILKQSYVRQGPALMFKQNGTDVPLVAGVYSTRRKALIALEADEKSIA